MASQRTIDTSPYMCYIVHMPFKQSPQTTKALKQIAKGKTPYRAAKDCGIALSTIYRALKRQRAK
jgi:hypothetical protein